MTRLLVAAATTLLTALAGLALAPTGSHAAAPEPGTAPSATSGRTVAAAAYTTQRRAMPKCRGKRATLIGRPGKTLRGTKRRDVIVTNGADYVAADKGNDLVCVTGGREALVNAGPGHDTVVVRQRRGGVSAFLGRGRDTFLGGPGEDSVYGSDMTKDTEDTHRDVIRTHGGDDTVTTGRYDFPNSDEVSLGAGDDELWLHSVDNRGGRLRGGTGRDRLVYMGDTSPDPAAEWVIDAATGRLSDRGTTLARFGGFDSYYLHALDGVSQHFVGSSSGETYPPSPYTVVSASMGGGDDSIRIFHFSSGPFRTSGAGLDGGPGQDFVLMQELFHGGDGDDTLVDGRHDDVLDGGAGNDSADGGRGTDTCVAETQLRCEA